MAPVAESSISTYGSQPVIPLRLSCESANSDPRINATQVTTMKNTEKPSSPRAPAITDVGPLCWTSLQSTLASISVAAAIATVAHA